MDNKQKIKLYRATYYTVFALTVFILGINTYMLIDSFSLDINNWLNISILAIQIILVGLFILDLIKTTLKRNKFVIAKCYYVVIAFSLFASIIIFALNYFSKIILLQANLTTVILLVICEFATLFSFVIGLKISKLASNTTITVDSTSETPNFNDEINLKKRLDELNRKLEIKKLQEEINQKEKELDS